jgi:UDP-2,4-diacetamido-2,4,6-trideoxy-beta-L-altropyranose hydrolase
VKIVFRTDASIQIGTGHVMRCLTLADELTRQGHECWFICREHPGHLGDLIVSKGHSLTLLPAPVDVPAQQKSSASDDYARWLGVPWQEDARQTLDAISLLSLDWLVVDHYALDAQWERTLSSAVDKIMVIDDLANRPHECALLLDQNLGRVASDYDGLLPAECLRLIGPRYALLRPEFAALRERSLSRRKTPELKRILISLGGVDRTNVTGQVLTALAHSSLPASTELDIIMGASAPYLDEVRQQAAKLPFKATVSVNVRDMAERMCLADLSIGAVGSTSWERCCLGLPAILIVLAENQKSAAVALKKSGAVIITDSGVAVRAELEQLMKVDFCMISLIKMANLGAAMVDGDGCINIVSELAARSYEF